MPKLPIKFPARYADKYHSGLGVDEQYAIAREIFIELEWRLTGEEYPHLFAKTVGTPTSFGERIIVKLEDGLLSIQSECFLPTQFLDFGKNRYNVHSFLDKFREKTSEPPRE